MTDYGPPRCSSNTMLPSPTSKLLTKASDIEIICSEEPQDSTHITYHIRSPNNDNDDPSSFSSNKITYYISPSSRPYGYVDKNTFRLPYDADIDHGGACEEYHKNPHNQYDQITANKTYSETNTPIEGKWDPNPDLSTITPAQFRQLYSSPSTKSTRTDDTAESQSTGGEKSRITFATGTNEPTSASFWSRWLWSQSIYTKEGKNTQFSRMAIKNKIKRLLSTRNVIVGTALGGAYLAYNYPSVVSGAASTIASMWSGAGGYFESRLTDGNSNLLGKID